MEETDKLCKYCGGGVSLMRRSAYCCVSCSQAARRGYEPSGIRGQKKRSCLWCSVTFRPATGKQKFCRKECAMASGVDGRKRFTVNCEVCDTAFKSRTGNHTKTCSSDCSKKLQQQRRLEQRKLAFGPPRTCRQCAKVFTWNTEFWIDYCSKACRTEARAEAKKRDSHVRRARKAKATIEHFGPTYILKRDNYICQACGVKTKPKEKPNHPLYPNVDHIVPLSVGGEHSKKNCRCVCTSCNSKKCNRTLNDQLLLFG